MIYLSTSNITHAGIWHVISMPQSVYLLLSIQYDKEGTGCSLDVIYLAKGYTLSVCQQTL